jgi:hypothetical protein
LLSATDADQLLANFLLDTVTKFCVSRLTSNVYDCISKGIVQLHDLCTIVSSFAIDEFIPLNKLLSLSKLLAEIAIPTTSKFWVP